MHCAQERATRVLEQRADGHRRLRLQQIAIHAWKARVVSSRRKHWLNEKARRFHRVAVFSRVFLRWQNVQAVSVHRRGLEEEAGRYHTVRLLAFAFTVWKINAHKSQQLRGQVVLAGAQRKRSVARQVLRHWRDRALERRRKRAMRETAGAHYRAQLLHQAWQSWEARLDERGAEVLLARRAEAHHDKRLRGRCWLVWHTLVGRARDERLRMHSAAVHYDRVLQRRSLAVWFANAQDHQVYRGQVSQAAAHHRRQSTRRCFKALVLHRDVRAQEDAVHEAALQAWQAAQQRKRLQTTWQVWSEATARAGAMREKHELVAGRHREALKRACFDAWEAWARQQRLKVRLKRQAAHFRRFQLLSLTFTSWKRNLFQSRFEQEKDALALWLWSVQTKRRAYRAWFLHHKGVKETARLRNEALERRRKYLVRRAVNQWIHVSSDVSLQMMNAALETERASAAALHARVRRFAQRWRRAVINKKAAQAGAEAKAARGTDAVAAGLPLHQTGYRGSRGAPADVRGTPVWHPRQPTAAFLQSPASGSAVPHQLRGPALLPAGVAVLEAWEPLPSARPPPRRLRPSTDIDPDAGAPGVHVGALVVTPSPIPARHAPTLAQPAAWPTGATLPDLAGTGRARPCDGTAAQHPHLHQHIAAELAGGVAGEITEEDYAAMKATLDAYRLVKTQRKELAAALQLLGRHPQSAEAAHSTRNALESLVLQENALRGKVLVVHRELARAVQI